MSADFLFSSNAQLQELREKLGDRRVRSMHSEVLSDDDGQPLLGLTFICTDSSRFTMTIDRGPMIDRLREAIQRSDGG